MAELRFYMPLTKVRFFYDLPNNTNWFTTASVAQWIRVLGFDPRGCGFDSCQTHQNYTAPVAHANWYSYWPKKPGFCGFESRLGYQRQHYGDVSRIGIAAAALKAAGLETGV